MNPSIQLKRILFPTDFSELAANALSTVIAMCKRHQAVLHVIHVVENRLLIAPPEANAAAIYVVPEMEEKGRKSLAELAEAIGKKHKLNVETHLEFGNPADSIRDKAIELGIDLIVMGTHGASGFREFFIGTNAYSVIRNTTIPVLTIPGKKKVKEFKRILFPIRATHGVKEKFDFLEAIIEKNEAELIIAGLSKPGEDFEKSDVEREIENMTGLLRAHNTRFRIEFYLCRNFAKKVLEIARKEKADLVVINASLDYKWNQFFVGPYAQQVVNHSKIPVLSIRTPDAAADYDSSVQDEMNYNQNLRLAF